MFGEHHHILNPYRPWALAVVFGLIIAEIIWNWRKKRALYNVKESLSNTVILVGYVTSKIVTASYQLVVLGFFANYAFFHLPLTVPVFMLTFVVADFFYYWFHRFSHQLKVFWAFHLVHHSSPWFNLTTAYRINWFSAFITPYFFIPAALLGMPPSFIALGVALNLFYQFFMHTEAVGKIPFLEGIINTPSAHRVHHGSNAVYIDKNYGGVFMVWDRLFGTYQEETEKVKYGVTTGFVSHNPFKLIFQGFSDLLKGKMNYKG